MMYYEKFVAAIKTKGRVLRERGDEVYIPFGSEYSVLLKNLSSKRALARVSIDGVDVGDGNEFVVGANRELEIERFITHGNKEKGNKFKFIERTGKIEDHRGIKLSDGLLRIEFQYEREFFKAYPLVYHVVDPYWTGNRYGPYLGGGGGVGGGLAGLQGVELYGSAAGGAVSAFNATTVTSGGNMSDLHEMKAVNNVGITVPGSESDQKFHTISSFPVEEQKHVIVLQLIGGVAEKRVKKAITVRTKITCTSCGKRSGAHMKFCPDCGTALHIV